MLKAIDNEAAKEDKSVLDALALEGARRMLMMALEEEVAAYVARHSHELDEEGRRLVVRNGKAKERKVTCGAGTMSVRALRFS